MGEIDRKLIEALSEDARQPLSALGATVGLSQSAVNERIRRLTERGAIRRVMADSDPAALGLPVLAFVWLALADGASEAGFRAFAAADPAIIACHHVTGPWSYLIQVRLPSLAGVEPFLAALKSGGWLGRSETILALTEVVAPPFRFRGE